MLAISTLVIYEIKKLLKFHSWSFHFWEISFFHYFVWMIFLPACMYVRHVCDC